MLEMLFFLEWNRTLLYLFYALLMQTLSSEYEIVQIQYLVQVVNETN